MTLSTDITASLKRLDSLYHPMRDHDGTSFEVYQPGFEEEMGRLMQLQDIAELRTPILESDWRDSMAVPYGCPCGVTNEEWAAYQAYEQMAESDDPLGDHHGRNI